MVILRQREDFTHDQLDTTQQSIRVISVDPELSPEGLVQCSIRQTTIDATSYNFLSYRWGSLDFSLTLIVGGKRLSINQCLHEFLSDVRTLTWTEPSEYHKTVYHLRNNLWIDAICIDQSSELEKIHQVAQMGKIYMNATQVVMWLGKSPDIVSGTNPKAPTPNYLEFVLFNEYWTRAWIAQEVILAKDPILMTAQEVTLSKDRSLMIGVPPISFPRIIRANIDSTWVSTGRRRDLPRRLSESTLFDTYGVLQAWIKLGSYRGNKVGQPGITQWLNELRDVKCTLIHDRIFSLLGLAEEGGRVPVDYSIPPGELIYRILEARDHEVCLCEVVLLNHILKVADGTLDTTSPCVYAQWKADPDPLCLDARKVMGTMIWSKLADMSFHGPMVVQVPLQKLRTQGFNDLCHAAKSGRASMPVQLKHGHVHDWQLVFEDGQVQKLEDSYAGAE
jgi:hypothetical protein